MIFSVNNGEYTIWIPIYTLDDDSYDTYFYRGLLIIELILSIFAFLFIVTSGYIIITTRAFHTNMNSLYAYFVISWMFSGVGNSLTTPYIIGTWKVDDNSTNYRSWWTDDVAEMTPIKSIQEAWPLFLGGFLTWYYMFVMTTCLFIMSLERICASYFIGNYENTSRLYLFFLLFLFQQFIILTSIYLVFCNRVHFIPVVSFLLFLNILAVLLFCGNRQYNLKIIRKFKKKPVQQSGRFYTLPVRFQAKENLRVFNLTVRVFVCGFVMIMCALILVIVITFKCVSSWDTFLTYCFNNIVHLNPLIICPVLIFSVSTWSKALLHSRLPIIDKITKITFIDLPAALPAQNIQQETETYFSQLKNVWEK
ncbi:hypothetical protein B9Z55_006890 [Caenorhabditis nigoni]|uniref:Serpentine receptor class gamma n=1 Tax=Caenorhabditis nigoni TaxID=1611254 RepID=A0A2G5V736_9PELO|nr:hypothetical protein B9Z55_006890 [Caenorhabditis nigoni]